MHPFLAVNSFYFHVLGGRPHHQFIFIIINQNLFNFPHHHHFNFIFYAKTWPSLMPAYPSSTSCMGLFDLPISMPTLSIFKVPVGDVFKCPQLGFKDACNSSFEPSKMPTTQTNSHSKSFLILAYHTRMPAGGHKGCSQVVLRRCL